ncbi:MAG: hypothetical protein HY336_00240, partial [Candidatus Doudnabacteria bacterium]|nr:hypothetical protein [Candidatus Doudnabacteria bacterium]
MSETEEEKAEAFLTEEQKILSLARERNFIQTGPKERLFELPDEEPRRQLTEAEKRQLDEQLR